MRWVAVVATAVALGTWGCVVYQAPQARPMTEDERELEFYSAGPAPSAPPPAAEPAPPPQGPPRSDAEVCEVREAIVAALRASAEPWAAPIAERTADAPCGLEPDGTARIGGWSLRACVEGCESLSSMRFVWREGGAETPSYAAEVVREPGGAFRCAMLGQYLVR